MDAVALRALPAYNAVFMEHKQPDYQDGVRWDERSQCRDADMEQFYVTKRGRNDGDPLGLRDKYCGHCVVVEACLAEAIDKKDLSATVVGGKTREERRQLIRADQEAKGIASRRHKPAVDPDRINEFWQNATYEEFNAVSQRPSR